jgi:PPOX class probable F420-dependent enzyme
MAADLEMIERVLAAGSHLAVVATTRADGTIHASLVNAGILDDPVTGEPAVAMVVRGDAVKLRHFRRTGRATAVAQTGWRWASVEGPVRIAGPDDLPEGIGLEAIPALLRRVFVAAGGTHGDWDEYDRTMAEERRAAVFVRPDRITGNG